MPARAALLDEVAHDVVGIVRVADGVATRAAASGTDVGHAPRAARAGAPRGLLEEAHGRVERRAAPHLDREQLRHEARVGVGDRQHVVRAHARGQQRLVRVAERRVGQQQRASARASTRRSFSAPSSSQHLLRARRRGRRQVELRQLRARQRAPGAAGPSPRRIAVDDDLAEDSSAAWSRGRAARQKRNSSGVSSMNRVV